MLANPVNPEVHTKLPLNPSDRKTFGKVYSVLLNSELETSLLILGHRNMLILDISKRFGIYLESSCTL